MGLRSRDEQRHAARHRDHAELAPCPALARRSRSARAIKLSASSSLLDSVTAVRIVTSGDDAPPCGMPNAIAARPESTSKGACANAPRPRRSPPQVTLCRKAYPCPTGREARMIPLTLCWGSSCASPRTTPSPGESIDWSRDRDREENHERYAFPS